MDNKRKCTFKISTIVQNIFFQFSLFTIKQQSDIIV